MALLLAETDHGRPARPGVSVSARNCRSPLDPFRAREPIDEPTKGASEGPLALHSPPLSACLSGDTQPLHKAAAPTDATATVYFARAITDAQQRPGVRVKPATAPAPTDLTEQY